MLISDFLQGYSHYNLNVMPSDSSVISLQA